MDLDYCWRRFRARAFPCRLAATLFRRNSRTHQIVLFFVVEQNFLHVFQQTFTGTQAWLHLARLLLISGKKKVFIRIYPQYNFFLSSSDHSNDVIRNNCQYRLTLYENMAMDLMYIYFNIHFLV